MTRRGWSLSVRLGWRLGAVMLAAVALASGSVAWRAIQTVHDLDDQALQAQLRTVVGSLPPHRDAAASVRLPDEVVARFAESDGDDVFLVLDGDRVAAGSDPLAAGELAPLLRGRAEDRFFRLPATPRHRHGMVGLLETHDGWRVAVLQGREQSHALLESLTGDFALAGLWLILPIGCATVAVGVATLRRGLRPVREASAAASLVGPASPGIRLPTGRLPREVLPLVLAMNDALARMERALASQRNLLAEAAHGLRTPLAVLTARLDLLQDARPELAAMRLDVDRMARLVGQLLRIGRLEGLPLDTSAVIELGAVAREVIAALVPLGLSRGVEIALQHPDAPVSVFGSRMALVVALTNLVENALAQAPPDSAVEVAIAAPGSVAVLDRGPGVGPEHRARIFRRFERGPSPTPGGGGLGLAIVAEIAAAHGGTVCLDDRPGGGAAFTLALRRATPASVSP